MCIDGFYLVQYARKILLSHMQLCSKCKSIPNGDNTLSTICKTSNSPKWWTNKGEKPLRLKPWTLPSLVHNCTNEEKIVNYSYAQTKRNIFPTWLMGIIGGHFFADTTTKVILMSRLWWPTLFQDATAYVQACGWVPKIQKFNKNGQHDITSFDGGKSFCQMGHRFCGIHTPASL